MARDTEGRKEEVKGEKKGRWSRKGNSFQQKGIFNSVVTFI